MNSLGLVSIFLFAAGFGVPAGGPPAPEDPRVYQVAPDDCMIFTCWSGVAKADASRNPTEKWMAQPEIENAFKKFRIAIANKVAKSDSNNDANRRGIEMIGGVFAASLTNASAIYFADGLSIGNDFQFKGAAIVTLGKEEKRLRKLMQDWEVAIKSNQISRANFEVLEFDGLKVIKFLMKGQRTGLVLTIENDIAIIASSTNELKKVRANLKTPAPQWLLDAKRRLTVERVSSFAYVNLEKVVKRMNEQTLRQYSIDQKTLVELQTAKSFASVAGLDDDGFLIRSEIKTDKTLSGIWSVLDGKPLVYSDLASIRSDRTMAFATRFSPEKALALLARFASMSEMKDEILGVMNKAENGSTLKNELASILGGTVKGEFDLNILIQKLDWKLSIAVQGEKVRRVFAQLTQAANKLVKDNLELGVIRKRLTNNKRDVLEFRPNSGDSFFAALFPNRIVVGKSDDLKRGVDKTELEKSLRVSEHPAIKRIFIHGKKSKLENPLAVVQVNLPKMLKPLSPFVDMIRQQEGNLGIGFGDDFRSSDIPSSEQILKEVGLNTVGVFRTKEGLQVYQRQVYPSASPITSGMIIYFGSFAYFVEQQALGR